MEVYERSRYFFRSVKVKGRCRGNQFFVDCIFVTPDLRNRMSTGGGAGGGGTGPLNDGVGAPCTLPPSLTPVDRSKAYCFR